MPSLQTFPKQSLLFLRCGPTETVCEEDIPEIHFPALGDGYSADELQPSLEPGFQMLHSLEQEEQCVPTLLSFVGKGNDTDSSI